MNPLIQISAFLVAVCYFCVLAQGTPLKEAAAGSSQGLGVAPAAGSSLGLGVAPAAGSSLGLGVAPAASKDDLDAAGFWGWGGWGGWGGLGGYGWNYPYRRYYGGYRYPYW